jgi:predicted GNAT family acetyltransferase
VERISYALVILWHRDIWRGSATINKVIVRTFVDNFLIVGEDKLSLLDNPAWNALTTNHASFAEGNHLAKRYPMDIAPIAATRDQSTESYLSLGQLLGSAKPTALAFVGEAPHLSPEWTVVRTLLNIQMVRHSPVPPPVEHPVEVLNISHIDEMLALTELNQLGRFRRRAPELGSYIGIHESDRLVAMAGEGFRFPGYTEISAVCTHPDRRGRGYASSLVSSLIQKITRRGETPFLHVGKENAGAIRVYEKLGFKTRCPITFVIVKRE